jgi:hypothetical protein
MDTYDSLLFTNARVITADPLQPRAEAVFVNGKQIVYVGSNQDVLNLKRSSTRIIDAQGCTLLPGFIDSHYHLWLGSAELEVADLDKVRTLDGLSESLQQHARAYPQAAWVNGAHLTYGLLPDGERLTRHHLDAMLNDRPVALMAYDYHTMWVNTPALQSAGLLHTNISELDDPAMIGVDGLPTGELREPAAYGLVLKHTGAWGRAASALINQPFPSHNQTEQAEDRALLRDGLKLAASFGITSLHNMDGSYHQLAFFAALEDLGELTCRIYVPYSISPTTPPESLQEAVAMRKDFAHGMARGGFVKFFMDGVFESWTAFLLDDYADRPGFLGFALYEQDHFNEMAASADRLGLQISTHAIGDAAVRLTLDGYAHAQHKNGPRDSRHRIEHIELVHVSDLPRFKQLGVIASMQPLHLPGTEDHLWRLRAGKGRSHRSFAWQSLREAGVRLVFGSDWPIVQPGLLPALQTALSRKTWQPGDPEQRQSLEDVIEAYTHQAAYAEFEEHRKGQLRPGFLADIVLLSTDLESISPVDYGSVNVVMTICDGRIVYQA